MNTVAAVEVEKISTWEIEFFEGKLKKREK